MNRFTKIIKAIMFSKAVVCTMGISLQARGQNGNGSHNGHDYVDLGLPSGTLWATCNVGAGTPEASGYYFAWGETQPKPTYDNRNYKSYIGDPATAQWGEDWRTPSYNEWDELIGYCTLKQTYSNGVYGMLITAPNGNSLFLPAAGYRESKTYNIGTNGGYWSSSIDTNNLQLAHYFVFGTAKYFMSQTDRWVGNTVRAVRSSR